MSRLRTDMVWQPERVLPYLLNELKQKIETITPVQGIWLTGSRARLPIEQWHSLEGKDWDILVQCSFSIVNTEIWTLQQGWYIDLVVANPQKARALLKNAKTPVELFPNCLLIV